MFQVPNKFRVRQGRMGSDDSYGNNGVFVVDLLGTTTRAVVIASDGAGWEHVSARMMDRALRDRIPTWEEMCAIKAMFWGEEDCVVQYHPPKSAYVNHHPHVLHLWRPVGVALPSPPSWMVGPVTG